MQDQVDMTKITGSSWGKSFVRGEDFACVRILFPEVFPPLTGLFFTGSQ
jgi:hypothetical protein